MLPAVKLISCGYLVTQGLLVNY